MRASPMKYSNVNKKFGIDIYILNFTLMSEYVKKKYIINLYYTKWH